MKQYASYFVISVALIAAVGLFAQQQGSMRLGSSGVGESNWCELTAIMEKSIVP